jgi:hypothetical protein
LWLTLLRRLGCQYYKVGGQPGSLAVADVNGDGKLDLATANPDLSTVSVLLNRGNGTFQVKGEYETGLDPLFVRVGDLDRDGKPDLVTANGYGYLSVLGGRGDGTFDSDSRVDYRTGGGSLAIGDLNADGWPDLISTNFGQDDETPGSVSVLLNRGNGTFLPRVEYPAGLTPAFVATADLNRDGKLDLAVANYDGDTVSVFLNRGDGTFEGRRSYGTGTSSGPGPESVAIGDLNSDGAPDLVSVQYYYYSVFLNRGDGTFQPKHRYGVDGYHSVGIGDLNGDGSPDIAVTNPTNAGSLLEVDFNSGDGHFGIRNWLEYATKNPVAVALANLNGDGRQDLATASVFPRRSAVSVLLSKPRLCNVRYVVDTPEVREGVARARNCRVGSSVTRTPYTSGGVESHLPEAQVRRRATPGSRSTSCSAGAAQMSAGLRPPCSPASALHWRSVRRAVSRPLGRGCSFIRRREEFRGRKDSRPCIDRRPERRPQPGRRNDGLFGLRSQHRLGALEPR